MIYVAQIILEPGRTDGPVKIGFSNEPYRRIGTIAANMPYVIRVLTVIKGGLDRERELHARFEKHRIKGEWFHPVEEILALEKTECHDDYLNFMARRIRRKKRRKRRKFSSEATHEQQREIAAEIAASTKSIRVIALKFRVTVSVARKACIRFGVDPDNRNEPNFLGRGSKWKERWFGRSKP